MCTNILLYKANVIYIYKGIRERTFIPRTAKTSIPLFMSLYFHFDYVYLSKKRGAGAGGGQLPDNSIFEKKWGSNPSPATWCYRRARFTKLFIKELHVILVIAVCRYTHTVPRLSKQNGLLCGQTTVYVVTKK